MGSASFQLACDIRIGNRDLRVGHIDQWCLRSAGTGLKLSVPKQLVDEFVVLLATAREEAREEAAASAPAVNASMLSEKWELVASQVSSPESKKSEPIVILVHRETSACILLATWPTAPSLSAISTPPAPPQTLPFEPVVGGDELHRGDVAGASCVPRLSSGSRCRTLSCPPRIGDSASLASNCVSLGRHLRRVSVGDRVEVEYEGQWFAGQVCVIEDGIAHVKCDADPPDVLTRAAVQNLRRLHSESHGDECSNADLEIGSRVARTLATSVSPEGVACSLYGNEAQAKDLTL